MSSRDNEHYEDSHDMIEPIRRLREAAEKKMNAFGGLAEYDMRIIRGQKSEPAAKREAQSAENSDDEEGR